MDFGIYVHVPFCAKKCLYCDFVSSPAGEDEISAYVDCLISEIESYKGMMGGDRAVTLFIGGGTPSLIDESHIERIIGALDKTFKCEFSEATIECNPESVTAEKMKAYKGAGINRVSIGVQSLNDNLLGLLGRIHDSERAIQAILTAKTYFDNVSADVMLGLPNQLHGDVEYTLNRICDLDIGHISAYGLSIEPGTAFYQMRENEMLEVNDDLTADIYEFCVYYLRTHGYERYEISNFCKPGFEGKHNLGYWQRKPYLGLGAAAYGFLHGERYNNILSVRDYVRRLSEGKSPVVTRDKVSEKDAMTETIMLSLRTRYGLDIDAYNREFSADFLNDKADALKKNAQFLTIENNKLNIKENYLYISNSIVSDLI